ncbi:MAG: hypothetical protein LW688_11270 [Cryomorphaceae bacterium]|nr:hypothetical protein [Cryomorphaceae bacterium]
MNRFINALLLFLFFPTLALTVFVGFDLPFEPLRTTGSQFKYREELFLILGLLLLVISLRRSKRVWVYTIMEALVFLFAAAALFRVTSQAWLPATALAFVCLDNIFFLLIGSLKKGFRAGVTSKAVIMADRDVKLVYFSGLRKVSIHQGSVYFDYIKELQLSFPLDAIALEERDQFFEALNAQLDRDKVFVTIRRN